MGEIHSRVEAKLLSCFHAVVLVWTGLDKCEICDLKQPDLKQPEPNLSYLHSRLIQVMKNMTVHLKQHKRWMVDSFLQCVQKSQN